ncbi:unnamed protein product, partial [marine sediment metagenome]
IRILIPSGVLIKQASPLPTSKKVRDRFFGGRYKKTW